MEYKTITVTADDILNGKPNSNSCCAIALAVDKAECMNREGKYEPGRSPWQPEINCSDEMYIEDKSNEDEYIALEVHKDDKDDVDDFIQAYDSWGKHGGGDILEDIGTISFQYKTYIWNRHKDGKVGSWREDDMEVK